MGLHKKFALFTGKHQVLPCEISEIFKNIFFKRKPPVAASNRLMGPAKAHNRKFSEYIHLLSKNLSENYYLKVFLKYLTRLIYHCTIKNFMKLFKFIFHTVRNPRALLFVMCQIIISRFKKMIAQSFYSNNMNLGCRLPFT